MGDSNRTSDVSQLAIYGGPRAVEKTCEEKWRLVPVRALWSIFRHGWKGINTLARGGVIERLERSFAELTGTKHALLMNSGTAALHSAYFAIGLKPGDEVIVPGYTFFASAAPLLQVGAIPVFCDVNETLTADPDDVERRITPRTRAICVVHVWGNPARMDRFVEIARKHDLALIEDCSHAHGATFKGRPVGSFGAVGCFSMQGTKPVSGGELGIAVTSDPELYDRMLLLGHFGRLDADGKSGLFAGLDDLSLGLKYRPHLYGAILAMESLEQLDRLNALRRRNYRILGEALEGCAGVRPIESYPESERGGLLEFLFRFEPEAAGGWNVGAFAKAVEAEGVPAAVDRYTQIGPRARLLPETSLFRDFDYSRLGGFLGTIPPASRWATDPATLPTALRLAERLVRVRPLTQVDESYVRQCGRAMRKVAEIAAASSRLRPEAATERSEAVAV